MHNNGKENWGLIKTRANTFKINNIKNLVN